MLSTVPYIISSFNSQNCSMKNSKLFSVFRGRNGQRNLSILIKVTELASPDSNLCFRVHALNLYLTTSKQEKLCRTVYCRGLCVLVKLKFFILESKQSRKKIPSLLPLVSGRMTLAFSALICFKDSSDLYLRIGLEVINHLQLCPYTICTH